MVCFGFFLFACLLMSAADGKVDTLGVQGQNLWSKQGTTPLAGKRPASAPPASRPTVPATPPLLHNLEVIHQQSLDADTGEGPQEAQKSVEEGVRTKEVLAAAYWVPREQEPVDGPSACEQLLMVTWNSCAPAPSLPTTL